MKISITFTSSNQTYMIYTIENLTINAIIRTHVGNNWQIKSIDESKNTIYAFNPKNKKDTFNMPLGRTLRHLNDGKFSII